LLSYPLCISRLFLVRLPYIASVDLSCSWDGHAYASLVNNTDTRVISQSPVSMLSCNIDQNYRFRVNTRQTRCRASVCVISITAKLHNVLHSRVLKLRHIHIKGYGVCIFFLQLSNQDLTRWREQTLYNKNQKWMETFDTSSFRRLLWVSWSHHITNEWMLHKQMRRKNCSKE